MDIPKLFTKLAGSLIPELNDWMQQDAEDVKVLIDLTKKYELVLAGESLDDGTISANGRDKKKPATDADEKENCLMPAPKGRPPRVRKRNTKDALEVPRNSRLTRSSRMKSVLGISRDISLDDIPRKTRSNKSIAQVLSTDGGNSVESSILSVTDTTLTGESRKGRRTTRKGKEEPALRASHRVTRSSTRASFKSRSSVCKPKQVESKRKTRSKAQKISTHINREDTQDHTQIPIIPDPQTIKKNPLKKSLFSPYSSISVNERVEAYEGLSSHLVETEVNEGKFKGVLSPMNVNSPSNGNVPVRLVPSKPFQSAIASPGYAKVKERVDSPVGKGVDKISSKTKKIVPLNEENDQDISTIEVELDIVMEKLLETSNNDEELVNPRKQEVNKDPMPMKNVKAFHKDDENEADDEWVTDDEDGKTPKGTKEKISLQSSTPKVKASSTKVSQEIVGSYKALRSRKITKTSTDMSLTLSAKAKLATCPPKSATVVQGQKPIELEEKEAELKKQQEREMEALKRKEELLKKRTEATKRKREEKMSKVKRTREEKEKEIEAKRMKKAKNPGNKKKKAKEVDLEGELRKTPPNQVVSHKIAGKNLDSTFTVGENEDAYNMTPHWEDVSPKQPKNPNDYGIADNSNCSSEEENDTRKKIPTWTKRIDFQLRCQNVLPTYVIYEFWQTKPRALNIQQLFGNHVSKKTMKRGLNYRTSSAMWNTPPTKK